LNAWLTAESGPALGKSGNGRVAASVVLTTIPSILIENIDFVTRAGHAESMASHLSVKRRYVDLLFVSSAACPPLS
jgi:hypothetical protein